MDRIRQHLTRRRRSSGSSSTPLRTRSLSTGGERREKERDSIPRHLILISDTPEFDQRTVRRFESEGLTVKYLPFLSGGQDSEKDRKHLENRLNGLEDDLEPGERYAVVAYKQPAYLLLTSHHKSYTTNNPLPRLCVLIAYYPTPSFDPENPGRTNATQCVAPPYPTDDILPLQVHLAAHQSPAIYDNYDANPEKKRHRCHVFFYPESQAGFAEHSEPTYDRIDAQLAWSRALDCIKKGFTPEPSWTVSDIEAVWAEYWQRLRVVSNTQTEAEGHASDTMGMMVGGKEYEDDPDDGYHFGHNDHDGAPSVNCVPTMAGGTDTDSVMNFYQNTFFPIGPQSQHIRLLSRTIGPDRIVDEVLLTFTHTDEIPWLLPGVPPTNRHVQIPIVLSGSFCVGKLARQNIYWDQASVLMQVGLLDPGLVPDGFQATGKTRDGKETVERLPVCGREEVVGVLRV